ncbi:MAG: putative DNA repair protein [Faunusvirus sp.]|jgi:exonuclease SbcC|uniref:Putative DNA repair protein n=1 Tax=Faunusvirus sp. TaxID=2487766 RepID=A0A3G4ZXM1_9VIRU|nr:MAG: putative DNA repair protein [Faunusvirus sp.]
MEFADELFCLYKYRNKKFNQVYERDDGVYIKYLRRTKFDDPVQQENVNKYIQYYDAKINDIYDAVVNNVVKPSVQSVNSVKVKPAKSAKSKDKNKVIKSSTVKLTTEPITKTAVNATPLVETCIDKLKNMTIKYVYHVADIHIRMTKRHQEYEEVFEKLYEYLRGVDNKSESIIVVCGDILHHKTALVSNQIRVAVKLFKTLSQIMPVILITGNHDANLTNSDIVDSLTPLVDNIENLYYLHDTGIYRCGNITFGVTSVFSKRFVTAAELDNTNTYKIALYHGPVSGCETDVGYRLNNELLVKDFDGYDYAFLGDIHRFQYMNTAKTMAYSSSLIQQNHGETSHHHGLLRWTLETHQSEFIEIANNYGYCTVDIRAGKMTACTIPPRPYIRFVLENTTIDQYNTILNDIKSRHDIQELVKMNRQDFVKSAKININLLNESDQTPVTGKANEMNEVNYDTLLEQYLTDKKIDTDKIAKIKQINTEINKETVTSTIDNNINNQRWNLVKLEFTNLFSYSGDTVNTIRFDTMHGVVGLYGDNQIGKSSIFDILLYTLFDETPRCSYKYIINNKAQKFAIKLEFKIGDISYFIEKTGKRVGKDIKIKLNFYKRDKTVETSLNDEDRQKTYKNKIRLIIGNYNDFIVTCMSLQKNSTGIIDMKKEDRKRVLKELLQLQRFDQLYETCRERQRETTAMLRDKRRRLDEMSKIDYAKQKINNTEVDVKLRGELRDTKHELRTARKNIDAIKTEISAFEHEINEKSRQIIVGESVGTVSIDPAKLAINIADKQYVIKQLTAHHMKLQDVFNNVSIDDEHDIIAVNTQFITDKRTKMRTLRDTINIYYEMSRHVDITSDDADTITALKAQRHALELDITTRQQTQIAADKIRADKIVQLDKTTCEIKQLGDVVGRFDKYTELIQTRDITAIELENAVQQMTVLQCTIDKLDRHKYNPDCEYCVNNEIVRESLRARDDIVIVRQVVDAINTRLSKLNHEINELQTSTVDKQIYISQVNTQHELQNELLQLPTTDNTIAILQTEAAQIVDRIRRYNENAKHHDENAQVKKKILALEAEYNTLENTENAQYDEFMARKNRYLDTERDIFKVQNDILTATLQLTKYQTDYDNGVKFATITAANKIIESDIMIISAKKTQHMDKLRRTDRRITDLNTRKNAIEMNIVANQQQMASITAAEIDIQKVSAEVTALAEQSALYAIYIDAMGVNGIQLTAIKAHVAVIENRVNSILSNIVNFTVKFQCDEKNLDIELVQYNSHDGVNTTVLLTAASGFETLVANIAIRIVLTSLGQISRSNFICFDEICGAIDRNNMMILNNIFDYLKITYDFVLIISHNETIKEQYDGTIDIVKVNGHSCIV